MIRLTRRYRFPAAHVLRSDRLSEARNREIFGLCANPAGHGHDYGIEVTVAGSVDPVTGAVVDLERLDAIVERGVVDRFSHRTLNDDPAFASEVPTAERIAEVVHDLLREPIQAETAARLVHVRILETSRNAFDFGDRA